MRISSVSNGLPFKAQVESSSPLVSGNWEYLVNPRQMEPAPKKGSFWKKALAVVATVGVVAGLLAWGRNTNAIKTVMNGGSLSAAEGFMNKCKYIVGKGGDYVKMAWDVTAGKLINHFRAPKP